MMDLYFLEFLIKERQQEIEKEFQRIHLSRAGRNPGAGILKKFILGFGEVLFAMGARLKKQYRTSIRPALSSHDFCSAEGQSYPKPSKPKGYQIQS